MHRPDVASLANSLHGPVLKSFIRGTHRTVAPEATLARAKAMARQIGVTRLGNVTGLDRIGIPVTVAVRPNSRSVSVSQGKGLVLAQAFASAMMEAIELFHGEELTERTRLSTFQRLSTENRVTSPLSLAGTGIALSDRTEIAWIEGYDLLCREPCWVPWEVVHTDYTLPSSHSGEHFLSGTNGLASGNHLSEAISAAICELVERDAVALWHAQDMRVRSNCRVDIASITDEDCRSLLDLYEQARMAPRLWDVTSDIGIATFICDIPATIGDPSGGLRRFRGTGCHPNRAIALARAMTEAAQTRLTYIAGIRDDLLDYTESAKDKLGAALLDAASQAAEARSFADTPDFYSDDVAADLRWELTRLRAIGIERAIVVDLTRPDLGIPVVRLVIPGLEWDCTHPRYVPGVRARRVRGGSA
ncbi:MULTISPECIES: YcaO-like family protein [unclassified Bradyrhizobium]|uniref:YcaO-like family protein n=1 Tax=unclassified Bradyrhizobium TaxID=2631580 RepID=UPI0004873757|nr:YcaO-like family protein [Bradyrhizobium sp. URHA0013]